MKSFSTLYILMLIKEMKKSQSYGIFVTNAPGWHRVECFHFLGIRLGWHLLRLWMPRQDCWLGMVPGAFGECLEQDMSTAIITYHHAGHTRSISFRGQESREAAAQADSKFSILCLLFSSGPPWVGKMPICLGEGDDLYSVSQFKC